MASTGKVIALIQALQGAGVSPDEIKAAVAEWLAEHVDPDTGYVIDDTFSIPGAAPDAKLTGDELNDLKSAIAQDRSMITTLPAWEIGGIDATNGNNSILSTRLRSVGYIDPEITGITAKTNYQFALYAYTANDTYVGTWDSSQTAFVKQLVTLSSVTITSIPAYDSYKYRVALKRSDNDNMAISEADNLVFVPADRIALLDTEISGITNKSIKSFTPSPVNAYVSHGYLYRSDNGRGVCFSVKSGSKYTVHVTGSFNRFSLSGCNSLGNGAVATTIYSAGAGTYTDKSYVYVADGTYSYVFVMLAYNDSSYALTSSSVQVYDGYTESNFLVNGVPVYTQDETKNCIRTAFVSDKYFRANDDVTLVTTATGIFNLYDDLVANYPQFVSKNTLTNGTFTNYEYVFATPNYNVAGQRALDAEIEKPVILITTGVHGYERSAVMSAYSFLKAMCENKYPANEVLQKCMIRIIPCVCPWGYTNDKRWNENGVNINRNFDAGWTLSGEAFTNDYSGPSAASEAETKLVQAWLDDYAADAVLFIDWHNSGFANEVSYLSAGNGQTDVAKLKKAYRIGIDDAIGYWAINRNMTDSDLIYGYTGALDIGGSCEKYGATVGFASCLETSWNQNETGQHSPKTIAIGAEAFSALLIGAIKSLIE